MSAETLVVYVLVDSSGSMQGEAIDSANSGLSAMVSALREEAGSIDSIFLSLMTFARHQALDLSLTPLYQVRLNALASAGPGPSFLGAALWRLLADVQHTEHESLWTFSETAVRLLFVISDGRVSDVHAFRTAIPKIRTRFTSVIALACGPIARRDYLAELTDRVQQLDTMDQSAFLKLLRSLSYDDAAVKPQDLPQVPSVLHVRL